MSVLRGLRRSPPLSAAEERRMIDETRARLATLASAKGGESRRLDARMQAAGDMRMVRVSGDLATEPPTSLEAITVLGASAVYEVQLVGPRERAADLAAIAERTAESVRVRPAPRWSHVLIGLALVAALLVSVLGTVVLVVLLTGKKRRRSSALAWPGIRG